MVEMVYSDGDDAEGQFAWHRSSELPGVFSSVMEGSIRETKALGRYLFGLCMSGPIYATLAIYGAS